MHAGALLTATVRPPEVVVECATAGATQQLLLWAQAANLEAAVSADASDRRLVTLRAASQLIVSTTRAEKCCWP